MCLSVSLYFSSIHIERYNVNSKTCVKWPLKNKQNKGLNDKGSLNEGRILQNF